MSLCTANRLLLLLSGPLRSPGLPERGGSHLTTYSLRRLGPSLAEIFGLHFNKRLPLGSWRAAGKEERAAAASAEMPITYADAASKLDSQRHIKTLVWGAVDVALAGAGSDTALEAHRLVFRSPVAEWRSGFSTATDAPAVAASPTTAHHNDGQPAASTLPPSSSSSSSSSSLSDSSDRAGGDVAEWAHPPGDRAKIYFLAPAGSLPSCAMGADIAGSGVGLLAAKNTGGSFCKFCLRRLNISDPEASNAAAAANDAAAP